MAFWDFLRKRCPHCARRGLRHKGGALVHYAPGQSGPPCFSLYLCPSCQARFRQDMTGPLQPANDAEWKAFVDTPPTVELV